jgi:hypothetical protein
LDILVFYNILFVSRTACSGTLLVNLRIDSSCDLIVTPQYGYNVQQWNGWLQTVSTFTSVVAVCKEPDTLYIGVDRRLTTGKQ